MERIPVRDPTDVATARRRIVGLATQMGYNETEAGRAAIVVTELAQNLLRHGGGGEMLAGTDASDQVALEVLALDKGPGMADVAACMRDGFSTGGTPGNGLGAVQRLARQLLTIPARGPAPPSWPGWAARKRRLGARPGFCACRSPARRSAA